MTPSASRARPPRILVTAGPTREHVDPVRYLTNESTGRMGFAIAAEAARAGAEVVLVAGPVQLPTPSGVRRVADWRPRRKWSGKWRKTATRREVATLELVENPDILRTLCQRKGARLAIGFALETGAGLARARAKLARKGADYIVLNGPASLGGARTSAVLLGRDGTLTRFEDTTKVALARALARLCLQRRSA
jgi:phosphopantothenoylcysteine decarboxylase/phosphopantothenate--cysteine ligase